MAQALSHTFRSVWLDLETLEAREMPSSAAPDTSPDGSSYADDRILVRWLNDTPIASPYAESTQLLGDGMYTVDLKDGVSVADALAWYNAQSDVDFAQTDALIQVAQTTNDAYASQQWALNAIGASTAWNYTTGSKQIVVAVIDTGVNYNHADLAANIWKNTDEVAGNGADDDGNGYIDDYFGYNFNASSSNPMDDHGHGSHVAGTIGAVGNNGTGVTGVNWNVQIMSLKFMSASGSGYTSHAVSAIYYAVNNGAKVINNSWGGGSYDAALANAIQYARSRGVIVVNAAGNSGVNVDTSPYYPASINYDNVLTVAATDQNNNLASFSNYGANTVDIAAPGVSILSTYHNGGYATMSGTSMAAPHVAGAAALIWSLNPTWTYSQVISALVANTNASASLNGKVAAGVLNIAKAAQVSQPTNPTPTPTPTNPPPSSTAPAVTANPSNKSIFAGATATFTSSASNAASVRWQVSTNGGATWANLSNGGAYNGVTTNTLYVTGAVTFMGGYKYRAVFTSSSNQSVATTAAVLSVTSNNTYNAYVNAYYSYIYASYAYATGGGQHAYAAYVNAYYAYYYAYYAHNYNLNGNISVAANCAYYSQYYASQATSYAYASYASTGNVYAYYAYYFAGQAASHSSKVMNGY
jgi:serine protease